MPFPSRRKVLAGLASVPLAYQGRKAPGGTVAIIGAGAAGLAAARRLRSAGLDPVIFEARHRAGGRAFTDTVSLSRPFDAGAHWIHSADDNPLTQIAQEQGLNLAESFTEEDGFFSQGIRVPGLPSQVEAANRRIERRARLPALIGADPPLSRLVRDDPSEQLAAAIIGLSMGTDPDVISLKDMMRLESGRDLTVATGLGSLVTSLADGLDIRFGSSVHRVSWGRRGDVELEGAFGKATAKACLVTVPTSLLARGDLRFDPALPRDKQDAVANLPLGTFEKIGLRLAAPLEGYPEFMMDLDLAENGQTHALCLSPDRRLATVLTTGRFARDLFAKGPEAAKAFAKDVVTRIAGHRIVIEAMAATHWAADPFCLGAYSYCKVGHHEARRIYAEPAGDRLFFAGEAADGPHAQTVGGAYLSGLAAARAIIAAL